MSTSQYELAPTPARFGARVKSEALGWPTIALGLLITSFFFTLPLGRFRAVGFNTDFRLYDFAFIFFFVFAGLPFWGKMRHFWRDSKTFHYWAVVFLFIVWVSLVVTALVGGPSRTFPALIRAYRFTYYFLTATFIVVIADTPRRYRFLLNVLYLNIVVQALIAFLQGIDLLPNFWPAYWLVAYGDLPVGTLSPHHKQIGIIMVMGIQLTMSYMRFSQSNVRRLLILVALAAMIMVPIFVGSRTAWLGFVALALGYLFVYGKHSLGLVIVAGIIVAGVYFLAEDVVQDPLENQIQAQLISTIENGGVTALGSGRTNIYTNRIPQAIAEHPWVLLVGSGFQNSATVIRGATAAHNNYLQALLELGFFGLAIYVKLLLTILRNLWETAKQKKDKQIQVVAQDAWVFFVAVLATMMVGESFWAQYSMFTLSGQILAYVAIASAPLGWPKPDTEEDKPTAKNGRTGNLVSARRR